MGSTLLAVALVLAAAVAVLAFATRRPKQVRTVAPDAAEASGLGLAEAKSAVDDLERQLAADGPLARLLDASPDGGEPR